MADPASRGASITRSLRLLALLLVAVSAGCSAIPAPTPQQPRAAQSPQWRAGDRWVYRINGSDKETRTIEVESTRLVSGQPYYYVLKASDTDLLNYWTLDLGWAAVVSSDSRVVARIDPPVPWFVWPLDVGRQWSHHGRYEDRNGGHEANSRFMVTAREIVEVPAGRFETLKIVREGESTNTDQYWYAPEVLTYVKWIVKRGDQRIEEELVGYKLAERLIPVPAALPPKAK
jgi:hypothetical protein